MDKTQQSPDNPPKKYADKKASGVRRKWLIWIIPILIIGGIIVVRLNHDVTTDQELQPTEAAPETEALLKAQDFRAMEQAKLNGYGPSEPASGIYHIPIDSAMVLWVEESLESR
ncbi:MAG: hypothetical protein ACE5IY_14810 [bacterium]